MDFQLDNNLPIWPQLLARMTERILTRQYPPGTKLPSVRELALEAGVNPNTIAVGDERTGDDEPHGGARGDGG